MTSYLISEGEGKSILMRARVKFECEADSLLHKSNLLLAASWQGHFITPANFLSQDTHH